MKNVFFVRASGGKNTDLFKKHSIAAINILKEPLENYKDKNLIRENYIQLYPNTKNYTIGKAIGVVFRFWNEIKLGDIIVTTYENGDLLLGEVIGNPYFIKDEKIDCCERIVVKWINETFKRSLLSKEAWKSLRSSITVFKVPQTEEILKLIDRY
jgi:predicted Mrr-cat superfamily restriction endonuclease